MKVTPLESQSTFDNIIAKRSVLIQEDHNEYTNHDQLFKELIHSFFEEFLEVFFS